MAQKKSSTGTGKKLAIGLGIGAAVAAGIAGAYFLYGKDGAKNRKKIKSWTLKAKAEAMEKIEKLKDVSDDAYHNIIDTVAAKYGKMKDITPEEAALFVKEMKGHWKHIKSELGGTKKPAAKKAVKKATKTAAKKK